MTAKEFVDAYNYLSDEVIGGTYEIDKLLDKYDSDGNLDLYEIFDELSEEDKETLADMLNIEDKTPYVPDAYALVFDAWGKQRHDNLDQYSEGVLDLYEALKAEGLIDLSYFDDEN